jgi:hypothetical protein
MIEINLVQIKLRTKICGSLISQEERMASEFALIPEASVSFEKFGRSFCKNFKAKSKDFS